MKQINFAVFISILSMTLTVYGQDQEAANNGVLILAPSSQSLETIPQLQHTDCKKFIVWDDAAVAFYRYYSSIPPGYCRIDVGREAIPMYEEARRKRGLPPGSYRVVEETIRNLENQLEELKKR